MLFSFVCILETMARDISSMSFMPICFAHAGKILHSIVNYSCITILIKVAKTFVR